MASRTYLASVFRGVFLALPALSGCAQVAGVEDWTPIPCNVDPWSCPAGQTCWINAAADRFECFNGGVGQVGEACHNYAGEPTCGEYLACLQLEGAAEGKCTPYCDVQNPAHACPSGNSCQAFVFPTPAGEQFTLYLCSP